MNTMMNLRYGNKAKTTRGSILSSWPTKSRNIARSLIKQYGAPHEATETMLIWHYNGKWKRTVVHRDGVQHNVPHSHIDILEQTVDTKVPTNKCAEVMKFDGSISINRTRGEMTTYCESEEANIFLMNLAHDISIGKKTAQEARQVLQEASDFFNSMLPNMYRESLLFTSRLESNDPDRVTAEPN